MDLKTIFLEIDWTQTLWFGVAVFAPSAIGGFLVGRWTSATTQGVASALNDAGADEEYSQSLKNLSAAVSELEAVAAPVEAKLLDTQFWLNHSADIAASMRKAIDDGDLDITRAVFSANSKLNLERRREKARLKGDGKA